MSAPDEFHFALEAYHRRTNWIDLDDIAGTIKFGGPRHGRKDPGSISNPYKLPIDLRVPSPRDGRPVAVDGSTSFHFRGSVVRKGSGAGSDKTTPGTNGSGDGGAPMNCAAAHERYLEDGWERELNRSVGIEDYLDDTIEEGQGRAVFVTSNIGQMLADRMAWWSKVWARDRTASPSTIEFDLDRCGEAEWRRFIADPYAPPAVLDLAAKALAGGLQMPKRPGRQPRRRCVSIEVGDDVDAEWLASINREFGARKADRAVHYREGRSGQVQMRFEVELPHELGIAANADIAKELGEHFRRMGIPFTIVVHVPTKRNDRRNVHLHLILHPRICPYKNGQLDLEAGRKLRPGDLAAMLPAAPDRPAGEPDRRSRYKQLACKDMWTLRWHMANLMNQALERHGFAARYDPRTHEEMGIASAPMRRLGSTDTFLMRAGVSVEADLHNAAVSRDAALRQVAEEARDRRHANDEQMARLRAAMAKRGYSHLDKGRLELLDRLMTDVADGRDVLAKHDVAREFAESASRRLIGHTATVLKTINDGTASAVEVRWKPDILARHAYAQRHLEEIEDAIEPYQEAIARFRNDIERQERRIDALVKTVEADIARHHWRMRSVLSERHPDPLTAAKHFDALIHSIHDQEKHLLAAGPVHVWRSEKGDYEVAGIGLEDRKILFGPAFARRRAAALEGIAKRQQGEIEKLLADVRANSLPIIQRPGRLGVLWSLHDEHPLYLAGRDAAQEIYERRIFGQGLRDSATAAPARTPPIARTDPTVFMPPIPMRQTPNVSDGMVTVSSASDHRVTPPPVSAVMEPVHYPEPVVKRSPAILLKPASSDAGGEPTPVVTKNLPGKGRPRSIEIESQAVATTASTHALGDPNKSSSATTRPTAQAIAKTVPSTPPMPIDVGRKGKMEEGDGAGLPEAIAADHASAPPDNEVARAVEQPSGASPVLAETNAPDVNPVLDHPQEAIVPARESSVTMTDLPARSDIDPNAQPASDAHVQSTMVPSSDVSALPGAPAAENTRSADTAAGDATKAPDTLQTRASSSHKQNATHDHRKNQVAPSTINGETSTNCEDAAARRKRVRDDVKKRQEQYKSTGKEDATTTQPITTSIASSPLTTQRQARGGNRKLIQAYTPRSANDLFHQVWSKRGSYTQLAPQDRQRFELFAQSVTRGNAALYRKDGDLFLWYGTDLAGKFARELLFLPSGAEFMAFLAERLPAQTIKRNGLSIRISSLVGPDDRGAVVDLGEGVGSR